MAGHETRPPPIIAIPLPQGITGGEQRLVCGLYRMGIMQVSRPLSCPDPATQNAGMALPQHSPNGAQRGRQLRASMQSLLVIWPLLENVRW